MTFKPVLWTYKPRKDGRCPVKIYCYSEAQKTYQLTGIAVHPDQWDQDKGKVTRANPLHEQMNAIIRAKVIELERMALEGKRIPTKTESQEAKKVPIVKFIDKYIGEVASGQHHITPSTVKNYQALKLRLNQFSEHRGKELCFEDVDQAFYGDFFGFLNETFNLQKEGGFSKHIKNLKKFMSLALKRGIHRNNAHLESEFKVHKYRGQKVYLTEAEMKAIEALDLSTMPWLEAERDRFLICYNFLLRYQDGQDHVNRNNFMESGDKTFFRYNANKTGIDAIIPVRAKVIEILEKYDYKMPKTSNQEANRKIKMIASMAGINTPCQENKQQGPKCSFVSTHTARRSAATNLALQGVPLDFIAKLGGWNKIDTLKSYLLASGLDIAMLAAEYDFFK